MAVANANVQTPWLAQNNQTPPVEAGLAPSEADLSGHGPVDETSGADYENGNIPGAPLEGSGADLTPPQGTSGGAEASKEAVVDPSMMDNGSTPPPPAYGSGGATPDGASVPPSQMDGAQGQMDDGAQGQMDGAPSQDASGQGTGPSGELTDPSIGTAEHQTMSTGVSNGPGTSFEPPLGVVPFIVFGVGAIAALIVYFSRRRKNWADIGDAIHAEGSTSAIPESQIATQFSEIQDLNDYRTQNSRQVSSFE